MQTRNDNINVMKTLYSSTTNGSCTFFKSTLYTKRKNDQYICHICQKGFNRPSALQTHSYIHTGEKPYQCTVYGCGRRFSVISNLRRHSKVHSRSTLQRTRLSSCERHYYVQKLMEKTASNHDHHHDEMNKSLQSNDFLSRNVSSINPEIDHIYNQNHHQQKKDSPTSFPLLSIQYLINHE
ncbi:unnamed protein product [Cunninghamella blakesleeana]